MIRRLLSAGAKAEPNGVRHPIARLEERLFAWLLGRAFDRGDETVWMRRHDALTGMSNRLAFEESLRALRRRDVSGSVAVVDLDDFKAVNDKFGHAAGDRVLLEVTRRLQQTINADTLVARFGGDEFAIFVPGPMSRARDLLDRLLACIRQPIEVGHHELRITASIGVAPLPLSIGLNAGVSSADIAMYAAKSNGRDQIIEFGDDIQGIVAARRELAETVVILQERNRALQEQVELDALTGLRSRRALDQLLEMTYGGDQASSEQCAVAFLDIDHFGSFNKHHGDDRGDAALRQVAEIVQKSARRGDLVFRKGGEEIVVVLPGATEEEAHLAAERMRSSVQSAAIRHVASPTAPVVTITVGVASSYDREPTTVQQLMNLASAAAMRAKVQAQRNQVHLA